jgi:hypothetical protein
MTMLLEDAQQTKQDLYLMMVDFSEAFDSIDHDHLLAILYGLGYPVDAIEIIKNLYTGAVTQISTPHGLTQPLPIDRGTTQGGSLSPFLFVNYLEPLLRWVKTGGRRYAPGVLNKADKDQTTERRQVTDVTFVDDLNLLTGQPQGMCVQAAKLTAYAHWACLRINTSKTLLAGIMHGSHERDPVSMNEMRTWLSGVRLAGRQPTLTLPTQLFNCLGVMFTMNLSWGPQFINAHKDLKDALHHLSTSCGTAGQKIQIINSSIRAKLRYGLYTAPYTFSTACQV